MTGTVEAKEGVVAPPSVKGMTSTERDELLCVTIFETHYIFGASAREVHDLVDDCYIVADQLAAERAGQLPLQLAV